MPLIAAVVIMAAAFLPFSTPTAKASIAGWDPGYIMSDNVFTDKSSMSITQIQTFLNSKVPACDIQGLQQSEMNNSGVPDYNGNGSIQRWEWGKARYNQTEFPCLPNYSEGGKSAAQIIYESSQEFSINPKVLIVLLQKEQGLVTDTWPLAIQYRAATGYGCPDTAPCDTQYYGLTNQLRWAARMFRAIMNDSPTWYKKYYPHWAVDPNTGTAGPRYVQYNPTTSCGGTWVNIQNRTTQALYNYTPYQPNQGALAAGWGTASCGAYGNRNFYLYYTSWFGSVHGSSRDAAIQSHSNTSGWLEYGQTRTVTVVLRNTGNDGWCADGHCPPGQLPTRLVTQNYANFAGRDTSDPAWINGSQIRMQTPDVRPGQDGVFTFRVKAPQQAGFSASAQFFAAIGGMGTTSFAHNPNTNLWIGLHAYAPPVPTLVSQTQHSTTQVLPNQQVAASVSIRNTSQTIWYSDKSLPAGKNPTRLYTPGYTASKYYTAQDPNWLTPSQIAMDTPVVAPGETAVFNFILTGPLSRSSDDLVLRPVIDGVAALGDSGIRLKITTAEPILSYQFMSAQFPPNTVSSGAVSSQPATITVKNTSNTVWKNDSTGTKNPTRLVMIFPHYRNSAFYQSSDLTNWLSRSQIAMKTPVVNPGENATFEFMWAAPTIPGNYLEYFSLVTDGYQFFPLYGSAWRTIVQ